MQTALILGAGSDLARALARRFATASYRLILAEPDTSLIEDLAKDLEIRSQAPVETVAFDALKPETHQAFYDSLSVKPDVVLCVFGYMGDQLKAETDSAERLRVMNVNYTGAVSILEVIATDFAARKAGTLIGISSCAGDRGRQSNYIYGSAKAGFTAYLSGLRNRLFHHGVHVMTVKPGFMRTAMTEGLDLPEILTAMPDRAAEIIFHAFTRKRNVIYLLWMWKWIMMMVRNVPECVFKRMKM
ncbi:MAG: SDR family oxidoreductase [Kiritimatiellae bacterium]|nr:SDR family oxidoreductase [Kiritimatiellia bacterium]MDD4736836.1 SDR family oxidoreductase [Kiritimatiellia bacterium]